MHSADERLVVASGNQHKVAELRAMLAAQRGLEVVGLRDVSGQGFGDPPEIDETSQTFAGNAVLKADGLAAWLAAGGEAADTWVLADDSGISIDALEGRPGVRSARFAGPAATDAENNQHMVRALQEVGVSESSAHYTCVLALRRVDGREISSGQSHERVGRVILCFEGRWPVKVRSAARGQGGFGYDPHAFLPDGRSVAELSDLQKAQLSHRATALGALISGWP